MFWIFKYFQQAWEHGICNSLSEGEREKGERERLSERVSAWANECVRTCVCVCVRAHARAGMGASGYLPR
jgi:hypothetical protein